MWLKGWGVRVEEKHLAGGVRPRSSHHYFVWLFSVKFCVSYSPCTYLTTWYVHPFIMLSTTQLYLSQTILFNLADLDTYSLK